MLFLIGIVVGGGYLLWQWLKSQVPAATAAAANAVTNTAANITGQNQIAAAALGPMLYHTVTMPDGSKASIASTSVDANGNFIYNGASYALQQQGNTYYGIANAGPVTFGVVMMDGSTQQIPASSVSNGQFMYQGATYYLVAMPDGSMLGLYPSSVESDGTFINVNNGIPYQLTQSGGGYVASVNVSTLNAGD